MAKQYTKHTGKSRGVTFRKSRNRWVAFVYVNGKTVYLGSRKTKEKAEELYDEKALELWGDAAQTNERMKEDGYDELSHEVVSSNGSVCTVRLRDGEEFVMDCDCVHLLEGRSWYMGSNGTVYGSGDGQPTLHREVLGNPPGYVVRLNGMRDLRKSSLKVISNRAYMTRAKKRGVSSRYKGVVVRGDNRIVALIKHNFETIYIGSFSSQEAAARAYDAKAEELFGDLAVTNQDLGLLD